MTKQLAELLASLRRGERRELDYEQIDALIAWLSGSFRQQETQQNAAGYDAVLVLLVLQQLEQSLLKQGHLDIEAAGLGPEQPIHLRRKRFRRLASVFHPDRFPDLADWLTLRSQAIHQAYARFKQHPDTGPEHERPNHTVTTTETVTPTAPAPQATRETPVRAWLIGLRARFGHDRRLAHKVIAALAFVAALPVANLYLASAIPPSTPGSTTNISSDSSIDTRVANETKATSIDTDASSNNAAPVITTTDSDSEDQKLLQSQAEKKQQTISSQTETLNKQTIAVEETTFGPSIDEPIVALHERDDRQTIDRLTAGGDISVQTVHETATTHSTYLDEPEPVFLSSASQAESMPVHSPTALTPFTQGGQSNNDTRAFATQGELVLGPLKQHPVGHLLTEYQSHVQSGNLNALMQLFSSTNPRQDWRHGSTEIADYYRSLFRRSSHQTIHLRVLRMQRDGDGWQVETALNFSIASTDGEEQIINGRTHFRIQPDRGILKIVAMEN